MKLAEKDSNIIYIMKAFAIFSVICAHVAPTPEGSTYLVQLAHEILNYVGIMGVPIFFIISGFLFAGSKRNVIDFWKSKLYGIVIPWLFCVSLVWLFQVVRKGGWSVKNWFLYLIGYNATSYYLTLLIVFYIIFRLFRRKLEIYVLMILSIISILGNEWKFIGEMNTIFGTFYLNPFNWLFFFSLGIVLRDAYGRNSTDNFFSPKSNVRFAILGGISFLYLFFAIIKGTNLFYFSRYALPIHLINAYCFYGLARYLVDKTIGEFLVDVGRESFSVYFLHLFIAGAIVKLTTTDRIFIFVLVRPILVLGLVLAFIGIVEKMTVKHFGFVRNLIGMR